MSDSGGTTSNDAAGEGFGGIKPPAFGGLVASNAALATQVEGLRKDLTQTERKRKRDRVVLLLLLAVAFLSALNQYNIRQVDRRGLEKALALSVGVCAIQNVLRIEVTNFLATGYNDGALALPGDTAEIREANAKRDAWLASGRKNFATVPCEALVEDERLEIRLEYPSTVPLAPTTVP